MIHSFNTGWRVEYKSSNIPVDRPCQLCVPEERRKELEQVDEKLSVDRPSLLVVVVEDLVHEEPVRNDFKPGVGETRCLLGAKNVKHVAVGCQNLKKK